MTGVCRRENDPYTLNANILICELSIWIYCWLPNFICSSCHIQCEIKFLSFCCEHSMMGKWGARRPGYHSQTWREWLRALVSFLSRHIVLFGLEGRCERVANEREKHGSFLNWIIFLNISSQQLFIDRRLPIIDLHKHSCNRKRK